MLLLVALVFAADPLVVPVEGKPFAAALTAVTPDWKLTFSVGDQTRIVPAGDVVTWGAYTDNSTGMQFLFVDGSLLVGDLLRLSPEEATFGDATGQGRVPWTETRLPLGQLRGIVFRPPADPLERDLLQRRVASAEGNRDQLLLENGDLAAGVLLDSTLPTLKLRTKDRPLEVPLEKVLAWVANPALIQPAKPRGIHAVLGFRDGTRLVAARIETAPEMTRVMLVGGTTLTIDTDRLWEELTYLQPFGSRLVYLSDLTNYDYKHIPFLDLPWKLGVDRNVLDGRLRSNSRVWLKGFGMHSTARLAFKLDEPFRRFQAEIAIDDRAGPQGSVIFRVFLPSETGGFRVAYESPIVRGGDKPLPIDIDIAGQQQLVLVVDFADHGDVWDHANWLHARLVR